MNVTVTSVLFQPAPFACGDCDTEIDGAVLSIFTVAVCVASTFPALSVLQNCTVCMPSSTNSTDEPVCVAPPSTMNCVEATPDKLSVADRISVTSPLLHVGSVEAVVAGACVSICTGLLAALVELPATSETDADAVTAVPSELNVASGGQAAARPESASEHAQWIVTGELYQPFAFGAVVGVPARFGATWSSFTVAEADADPPGLVAVHVNTVPLADVSVEMVVGSQPVLDEIGESGSTVDQLTLVGELFQPAAFGAGDTVARSPTAASCRTAPRPCRRPTHRRRR